MPELVAKDKMRLLFSVVSLGLGFAVGWMDSLALAGDDSAQLALFAVIFCAAVVALAYPKSPWLWGLLIGAGLPAFHGAIRLVGRPDPIQPDSWLTLVFILAVASGLGCVSSTIAGLARGWRPV